MTQPAQATGPDFAAGPVIDVHSHYIPPAYWAAVQDRMATEPSFAALAQQNNLSPQPEDGPMRTLASRIGEMDAAGVGVSVLSLPPPGTAIRYGHADLARRINDELIEAAASSPAGCGCCARCRCLTWRPRWSSWAGWPPTTWSGA